VLLVKKISQKEFDGLLTERVNQVHKKFLLLEKLVSRRANLMSDSHQEKLNDWLKRRIKTMNRRTRFTRKAAQKPQFKL